MRQPCEHPSWSTSSPQTTSGRRERCTPSQCSHGPLHVYCWHAPCSVLLVLQMCYTCMRARNLTKPCKGKVANPRVLSKLSQGKHPYDDKNLATAPRRMTVDDVGYASKEQGSWSDGSVTGCEREVLPTPPHRASVNTAELLACSSVYAIVPEWSRHPTRMFLASAGD